MSPNGGNGCQPFIIAFIDSQSAWVTVWFGQSCRLVIHDIPWCLERRESDLRQADMLFPFS